MKQKMELKKEDMLPIMKQILASQLKEDFKKKGITGFRLIDLEWIPEGLIIYYDIPNTGPNKAKRK